MEEIDGEEIVEKYVTPVKEKKIKPAHVGGPFPKKNNIEDHLDELNKQAVNNSRDY